MKKLVVAGWALAAFALTASSASAEIITLRCTLTWHPTGEVEVKGAVIDTELRTVRWGGTLHTVEGRADGGVIRDKVSRVDNDLIVFGWWGTASDTVYEIDRFTGSITVNWRERASVASGSCERAQAAF